MVIGPFSQVLTLSKLPLRGALSDEQLEIITDAGLVIKDDKIVKVGSFNDLLIRYPTEQVQFLKDSFVAFPGLLDVHTHICWAGSRAGDYASRLAGKSYQEIAKDGGGIMDTVHKTRVVSRDELIELTVKRADELLSRGVTTIEVKSGYGLSVEEELRLLEVIQEANQRTTADLVPTCLAAHVVPSEYKAVDTPTINTSSEQLYLKHITERLLPEVKRRKLSSRVDIFVDEGAFSKMESREYLRKARDLGFDLVIHGDQFSTGAAELANEVKALSIDHLEAADIDEIITLANGTTIPVVLPGASLGLGEPFAPARKLLDAGCSLVIASDWNPGSAPMGNLLMQASVLGAAQRLSMAEIWAALTVRAAAALKLSDRGCLQTGMKADVIAFSTNDFREVLYRQGEMNPKLILKNGIFIKPQ
jgi:imidazolonepropionase